ncbi:MAG: BatA domain-containing protein [Bacteroidetes bacterium]|nr:BatA domain-containing protein [Bacteroidota bacterium]
MLQLLHPSWLFVLAGISIPVIIHLWNQRPGRILKVGSISLIPEETKEYKRNLQLSDLLLLLFRCLLIGALAFVLSDPAWKKSTVTTKQKGWILIPAENFNPIYSHFKTTIDSLYKAGFEFHYFDEGFTKEKLEDAIIRQPGSVKNSLSYWKLAESLDATLTVSFPLYIFTDNFLSHFSGNRPVLSIQPDWQVFTPASATTGKQTENKDSSSIVISLFTDKYSNDVSYIKAAINAIQSFSKRNISLALINDEKQIPSNQDWLFWLSDLPLKKNIPAKNIFHYAGGKVVASPSVIIFRNSNTSLPLYKITRDSLPNGNEVLWQDGFGNPVLSLSVQNEKNIYSFFSRFDPAWNELVWNHNFPAIVYILLSEKNANNPSINDNRIIDQNQLQPAYQVVQPGKKPIDQFESKDISGLFWILVFLLFFAERVISFYNTKLKTNE